jgi:hypothetical protein
VTVVEHEGEKGMSQEQEMRFEETQHNELKPGLEEMQREEPRSTFKDEIFGYRSYASETAGQKIQEVSEQKIPTPSQRLFLAVISLGMLMFVSMAAMFIFARMGTTPTMIDSPGGPMMWEHHHRMMYFYSTMGTGNDLMAWLLLVPLALFFIATIAINVLFSRKSN